MRWWIVGTAETGQSFSAIAARVGKIKGEVSRLVAKYSQTEKTKTKIFPEVVALK